MCHGFIDPRFLIREAHDRLTDDIRVPAPEPAPRLSLVPGLAAALRRFFVRPQPERATIAAE